MQSPIGLDKVRKRVVLDLSLPEKGPKRRVNISKFTTKPSREVNQMRGLIDAIRHPRWNVRNAIPFHSSAGRRDRSSRV